MSPSLQELQEVTARAVGWGGGVNIRDAANQLAPDEARAIENELLDERGGAAKRKGCQSNGTIGSAGDRIISTHTFNRPGLHPQVLAHTNAGKLYYTNDQDANPVVWTQITTGLSNTVPLAFENFNSKAYMSDGVDNYASWDGTTYATYPSAPKGKYLRLWKDTMWMSGISGTGLQDRVYSSAAGDAESWPATSWVDIAKGDGDAVSALATDGSFLVVGKRDRTFAIYDPVTFANRVTDFEKGIESHFSVAQFEGQIYFLSRRGVCLFFGDAPSRVISEKLDPLFDDNVIAIDQLWQARAYTIDNRIGWAIPEFGQTHNSIIVEYYPRLAGLTPYGNRGVGPFVFHRMPVQCFSRVRYGGVDRLYAGHNNDNKFLQLFADVGTDDGVPFVGVLETGAYDFGAPTRTKYIRRLRFLGRGRVNCYIKRNFESAIYRTLLLDMSAGVDVWGGGDVWGTGTWGPDSLVKEIEKTTDAYGRYFSFRFEDSSETGTGLQQLMVGATQRTLVSGEWAMYGLIIDGDLLGKR